jgi:hypothetical protein
MHEFSLPRDYGGNSGGRRFLTKGATYGMCESCGLRRIYPVKAWHRRTRIVCPRCGDYIRPSVQAQTRRPEITTVDKHAPVVRCCITCGAKLNSRNKSDCCAPCTSRGHSNKWLR